MWHVRHTAFTNADKTYHIPHLVRKTLGEHHLMVQESPKKATFSTTCIQKSSRNAMHQRSSNSKLMAKHHNLQILPCRKTYWVWSCHLVTNEHREKQCFVYLAFRDHFKTQPFGDLASRGPRKIQPFYDLAFNKHRTTRSFGNVAFMNAHNMRQICDLVMTRFNPPDRQCCIDLAFRKNCMPRSSQKFQSPRKTTMNGLAFKIHCKTLSFGDITFMNARSICNLLETHS